MLDKMDQQTARAGSQVFWLSWPDQPGKWSGHQLTHFCAGQVRGVGGGQYWPGHHESTTAVFPAPANGCCHGHQIFSPASRLPPHQLLHLPQPLLHLHHLHLLRVELQGENLQSQRQVNINQLSDQWQGRDYYLWYWLITDSGHRYLQWKWREWCLEETRCPWLESSSSPRLRSSIWLAGRRLAVPLSVGGSVSAGTGGRPATPASSTTGRTSGASASRRRKLSGRRLRDGRSLKGKHPSRDGEQRREQPGLRQPPLRQPPRRNPRGKLPGRGSQPRGSLCIQAKGRHWLRVRRSL